MDHPVITAMKATQRSPGRLSIYVDRKFVGALPDARITELGLAVGREWDAELRIRVEGELKADKALRYAMRLLNRRSYSRNEMRQRMERNDHAEPAIVRAMATLERMNLLDDASYGRAVIERVRAGKPAGSRLLRHKLIQKKLDAALIDRLIHEAEQGRDTAEDARALAEQRLATPAMQRCDTATRKRRLWGYLARRGFDTETIHRAIDTLHLADEDDLE